MARSQIVGGVDKNRCTQRAEIAEVQYVVTLATVHFITIGEDIVTEEVASLGAAPNEKSATPVWILAFIALIAALYLARAFFVPLFFGILVSYALRPVVDWLGRYRIPRALGAACVLAVLVSGASWTTFALSDEAAEMVEQLPEAARKLRHNLDILRTGSSTASASSSFIASPRRV